MQNLVSLMHLEGKHFAGFCRVFCVKMRSLTEGLVLSSKRKDYEAGIHEQNKIVTRKALDGFAKDN